ncbi:MAG: threonylcarbamoyl-AMP synthase [Proteobacteria bacterium]|nr:threonylcarbamoyl-AMP synthase [Pseudomonadota bacterium]MDE3208664.1 threonylcarbamoyl-AMP synthase [Pseudomonadota bacterium]
MAQFFLIHPKNPQLRLLRQAASILDKGGLIAYPTDSSYAFACALDYKLPQEHIRRIRGLTEDHPFSLVCQNLADISVYAHFDNSVFRLLKSALPGPYTFILRTNHQVPKRLMHVKRNVMGFRIPDHSVVQALLSVYGRPFLSSTMWLPQMEAPLFDANEIREMLEHEVDLILDGGPSGNVLTTVIDLTHDEPVLIRAGAGDLTPFGLFNEP